jgi:uncharacterized Zn-finger protein
MEQNPENYDVGLKDANVKIMNRNTDNVIKSHKCNQCSYSSSRTGHLETNLKQHNGENATNVTYDYATYSTPTGSLRRHLKTHSGEKSNMNVAPPIETLP